MHTVFAGIGDRDRDVDHLLGDRIDLPRCHHFLAGGPYPFQQIRVIGQGLPEVIDEIGLPDPPDIIINSFDLSAGLVVFNQFYRRHENDSLI